MKSEQQKSMDQQSFAETKRMGLQNARKSSDQESFKLAIKQIKDHFLQSKILIYMYS